MDIKNRVAIITGASRGIGAGVARFCHDHGMRLGLCARSSVELPDSERVVVQHFDMREEVAVHEFAARVVERFGHIDLWINNAGVLEPIAPLRDASYEAFQHNIDVNVMGVFLGSRAYARHIRTSKRGGVLINMSSGAGQTPYVGWSAYCASKAAVDMMSRVLQEEERDAGLRVHSVAPGIIDTAMHELIRSCDKAQFPLVDVFHGFKERDAFSSPEFVARNLLELAFVPTPEQAGVVVDLPAEHPDRF